MTRKSIDVVTWLKNWFQEKLVSGSNIKTINNQTLLGSGNININEGGNVDEYLNTSSTNPVQNQAIANAFEKIVEDLDDVYYHYGGLFRLNEIYDTNELTGFGDFLVYSVDANALFYAKTGNMNEDEIATMGDIPSLTNYVQKSSTTGLIKNDGTIMSGGTGSSNYAVGNHTHSNYELNTNKTSSITSDTGSTTKYPTVKAVEDALDDTVGMNIEDYYLDTTNDEIVLEYSNNGDMPSGFDISDLTDVDVVNVVVTYEDDTTETIKLLKYTGS